MYNIKIQPTQYNTYILLEDFNYDGVVVPKGFETNGADVPRVAQNIFPPFQPRFIPAIIIHDYLIQLSKSIDNKELRNKAIDLANDLFEEMILKAKKTLVTRSAAKLVKLYWKIKKPFLKGNK